MSWAQSRPSGVPTRLPRTPINTPTAARAGWKTPATTGVEMTPPTLPMLPVANRKSGARSRRMAAYRQATWMLIHTAPTASTWGASAIAARSPPAPIVATIR